MNERLLVVGLGKLGLPMAAVLSAADFDVYGADLNADLVARVNAGECPYPEPGLPELLRRHPIQATTDPEQWAEVCDAAFIVVPTPSLPDGRFDSGAVCKAVAVVARGFARRDRDGIPLIVVCSTVMPGECEGAITQAIEAEGLIVGETVHLASSPEFVALGDVVEGMRRPAQVLVGGSDAATSALCAIYFQMYRSAGHLPPVRAMPLREAEVAKIAVNAALVTKIAFTNELGFICERAGVESGPVVDAVGGDPRIGRAYLTPGGPATGPCFPRDARAYRAIAGGQHAHPELVSLAEAAENVSHALKLWMLDTLERLAVGKPVVVGIAGMAYKPGTPVTDESLGSYVCEVLCDLGVGHVCCDPMVPGSELDPREATDVAVWAVCTPHPEYVGWAPAAGQTIVDPWGICSPGDGRIVKQWEQV